MNYSKKSTSRKQKALKGKGTKMGKKLGVVFMKTLLVLIIALGVAGLCGGIGIIKGVWKMHLTLPVPVRQRFLQVPSKIMEWEP